MKKTTYALIALLAAIFIFITVIIYSFSLTGRPWRSVYPDYYDDTAAVETEEYEYSADADTLRMEITVDPADDVIVVTMPEELKQQFGIDADEYVDRLLLQSRDRRILIK